MWYAARSLCPILTKSYPGCRKRITRKQAVEKLSAIPQKDFPRQDIEDELIVGIIGSLLFAALLLYRLSHGCRAIRLREKGISLVMA